MSASAERPEHVGRPPRVYTVAETRDVWWRGLRASLAAGTRLDDAACGEAELQQLRDQGVVFAEEQPAPAPRKRKAGDE